MEKKVKEEESRRKAAQDKEVEAQAKASRVVVKDFNQEHLEAAIAKVGYQPTPFNSQRVISERWQAVGGKSQGGETSATINYYYYYYYYYYHYYCR